MVFAAGIGCWIAAMHGHADYLEMLPGMLITGVGVGLTVPTLIGAAVASLPPASFSTGSAVATMARQIGSVLGVAVLVAILDGADRAADPVLVFHRAWWFTAATAALAALASFTLVRTRTPASPADPSGTGAQASSLPPATARRPDVTAAEGHSSS